MRLSFIILHLLLALVLVANGVGSVFAATRMQIESFGPDAAVVETQLNRQAPAAACHEHAGMDATAMQDDGVPSHSAGDADNGTSDCCDSGLCVCACVLHAVAEIANGRAMEALIGRDTTVQILDTGHAAPALPHLIRPPIG